MDNGTAGTGSAELRRLVAQVVREVVADVAAKEITTVGEGAHATRSAAAQSPGPTAQPTGPISGAARSRTERVRITSDADLQQFAFHLVGLFENPKAREDIRTGRLRFQLAGGATAPAASGAVERIDSGAVTERRVAAAAEAGASLLLGRRAVLTPLAREKARALGVPVEKERR
ncbi:hypothetical protein [Leekyejoonella antrihumi]|uniref:hypothetical protein n=1 Tax=Leekyejoonella antrihumi TaxID=1660198 RepID=UPI001C98D371|nr:hypothetical protein [Leekyejoonella antrihumi]